MYKGCTNEACVANQDKCKFKKDEEFCCLCGEKLSHVCATKSCYKFIEGEEKYCLCCEALKKEKSDKWADGVKKVGAGVIGVAPIVMGAAKLFVKKR